jgi:hypothetical protein
VEKLDPDSHQSGKLDPDPHQSGKLHNRIRIKVERLEALDGRFGALEGPNVRKS